MLHTKRWINSPYFWSGVLKFGWKAVQVPWWTTFPCQNKKKDKRSDISFLPLSEAWEHKKTSKCTITTIIVVYSWQVKRYCQVRRGLASYHTVLLSCCFKMKPELLLLFSSSYGPYLTTTNKSVHNHCVRTFPPFVEFINLCLYLKICAHRSTSQTVCMHGALW